MSRPYLIFDGRGFPAQKERKHKSEDLAPLCLSNVQQGHVVVRVRRSPREIRNPSPAAHHPSPTYIRPAELRLSIPTLSDLKVSVGDEVEEGEPIAVEATEEILGAMRDLQEARSVGGIVGTALAWLAELRLAFLKSQSLILSPISGTVAGVKVEGGDGDGITVVLRLCPASAPPAGTSMCRAQASDEVGAPPAGGPSHDPACCPVEAYFVSPRIDYVIKRLLLELIRGAKESIEIATYSFTDDDLGEAVVEAHRRGVRVRVIADTSQPKVHGGEYRKLIEAGIPVLVERLSGLMHHKFMVVDRETVVTGSYNWSAAADEENFENAIVVRDPEVAEKFPAGVREALGGAIGREDAVRKWKRRLVFQLFLPFNAPVRSPKVPGLKKCPSCGRFVIETAIEEGRCLLCREEPWKRFS